MEFLAGMGMPITTVDKYDSLVLRKYKVGMTGQVSDIFAVTETIMEKGLPDGYLNGCIFAPYPGHVFAPLFTGESVWHITASCTSTGCFFRVDRMHMSS